MIHTARALRISNTGKPGQTSVVSTPVVSASVNLLITGFRRGGRGRNNNGGIMGGWIRDDRKFDVLGNGGGFLA